MFCQCTTAAKFVHQVVVVGGPKHLYEFDYVGVTYFGQDCDLVISELAELGCGFEFFCVHYFYCENSLIFTIFGLMHESVLTTSHFLHEDIIFDDLIHLGF